MRLRRRQASLTSFFTRLRAAFSTGLSRQCKLGLQNRSERCEAGLAAKGFTIVELLIVVVVIAILAAIVIVSYNGITSQAKESVRKADISTWKKKSEIYKIEHDITCPDNWAFVYGNPQIPGSKDFCVMKYEAKIKGQDDGKLAYNPSFIAESRASGTPWTNIWQTEAIAEASSSEVGVDGSHLITETEWMTLAADVLSVKYNWSGGVVGGGFIYSGHNDNAPANALAASPDDEDGYYGTGDQAPSSQRRTLYLTSGDVIWDMAGNVYDWTSNTMTGAQPGLAIDNSTGAPSTWKQWNGPSINWGSALAATSRPSALAGMPGVGNVNAWASSQGIGQLYSNQYVTDLRALRRGGTWVSGAGAGVLTLNISNSPTARGVDIGFRAAR